jgi:uncharacterized protein (TIGR02145 family)
MLKKINYILFFGWTCIALLISSKLMSQTTGLNFQGIARNPNGIILASQNISLRFSILNASTSGTVEYIETRLVVTNAQGIFSIVIGDGSGTSNLGTYALIDWKQTPKFLKVEMDPAAGSNFTLMGTTQLQTVPYANFSNYSATAGSIDASNIIGIIPVNKGGTGVSDLSTLKTNLNLDKVNNTSDLNKPISSLTQASLNLKLNLADSNRAYVTPAELYNNRYDTSYFYNQLNSKAGLIELDRKLNSLDTISLSNRIDTKANGISVTSSLAHKEDISNKSTASDLGGAMSSDILYPSQKAVKNYIAANVSTSGVADGSITTAKLANNAVTDAKVNLTSPNLGTPSYLVGTNIFGTAIGLNIGGNAATASYAITSGTASSVTTNANLTGVVTSIGNTTSISNGAITNSMLTNTAVGNLSGTNTGDETSSTIKSKLGVTTLSGINTGDQTITLTGDVIGSGTGIFSSTIGVNKVTNNMLAGNIAASKLIGSDLTTVGTINNGVWSATSIDIAHGGTGATNAADARHNLGISTNGINILEFEADQGSDPLDLDNTSQSGSSINVLTANNIFFGTNTLQNNNNGIANTAIGEQNLKDNTSGSSNTAFGYNTLSKNTIGNFNSAYGSLSLNQNVNGFWNTAIGAGSLFSNQDGISNTAIGAGSLFYSVSGYGNTSIGTYSLNNSIGDENTAVGHNAMRENVSGNYNVAFGRNALKNNTDGEGNVSLGYYAGTNNLSGNNNVLIGKNAEVLTDGIENAIAIGAGAVVSENNTIQLGADGNDPDYPAISKINTKGIIKSNGIDIYVPLVDEFDVQTVAPIDGTIVHAVINGIRGLYYYDASIPQWMPVFSNSNVVDLSNDQNIEGQKTFKGQIIAARGNDNYNWEPNLLIDDSYNSSNGFPTWLRVGSWNAGAEYGIVGGSNQFFAGTAKGDIALKAFSANSDKKMFIGATLSGAANLSLNPNGDVAIGGSLSIGVAEPNRTAALDVSSTNKGFLPPRMTTDQRDNINDPAAGLMIWCTNGAADGAGELQVFNGYVWRGLVYGSVPSYQIIGDQKWQTKNLEVTNYANGDPIYAATSFQDFIDAGNNHVGAYIYPNNDNTSTFGLLYNAYAIHDSRGLAPSGWHVPSKNDFAILSNFLGGSAIAGAKMKQTGIINWMTPNSGATNSSGLNVLPAGFVDYVGAYSGLGTKAYFWTSTDVVNGVYPYYYYILNNVTSLQLDGDSISLYYESGLSIRLIKD